MTYRFEKISRSRVVGIACVRCGSRRSRTLRVTHTVNPFNRNADGTVRTWAQVDACVAAELSELVQNTDLCATCAKVAP